MRTAVQPEKRMKYAFVINHSPIGALTLVEENGGGTK